MITPEIVAYEPLLSTIVGDEVWPFLRKDLRGSQKVTIDSWVEGCFGISSAEFQRWSRVFDELDLFHEPTIQRCLSEYCKAGTESLRHRPFADMCNHIVRSTRTKITGQDHFPVDDFTYIDRSTQPMGGNKDHRSLDVERSPGVVGVRRSVSTAITEGSMAKWTDILLLVELGGKVPLEKELAREIDNRRTEPRSGHTAASVRITVSWMA